MFFTKANQRKLSSYIYSIKDETRIWREGFEEVGDVMVSFYKKLLGPQPCSRSPLSEEILNLGHFYQWSNKLNFADPLPRRMFNKLCSQSPIQNCPGQMDLVADFSNRLGHR